jgi:general L-amino acid transport system substrate-binding protein
VGVVPFGWPGAAFGLALAVLGQADIRSADPGTAGIGPAEAGHYVQAAAQSSRLERIKARGELGCGIEGTFPGFAEQDARGRYHGLDIDICRAVAAALFGVPDRVSFRPALAIEEFRQDDAVDLVSRRLTWELRREAALGLLFGPVTFHDGQGFLAPARLGVTGARQLPGHQVCVAGGTVFEVNLNEYAARQGLSFGKTIVESHHDHADIASRLADGRGTAYTGDVSDLGAIRARLPRPAEFAILEDRISDEPLAPIVRERDVELFAVVRWTIFALIAAEALGITSANVDEKLGSPDLAVRRFLGVVPGNGRALQLDERWAYQVIKSVGNYGEIFERNLGQQSPIKLDRGRNRLFRDGGLMWAPPMR